MPVDSPGSCPGSIRPLWLGADDQLRPAVLARSGVPGGPGTPELRLHVMARDRHEVAQAWGLRAVPSSRCSGTPTMRSAPVASCSSAGTRARCRAVPSTRDVAVAAGQQLRLRARLHRPAEPPSSRALPPNPNSARSSSTPLTRPDRCNLTESDHVARVRACRSGRSR